ncbi:MAG TPA: hypothetical protein VFQ53_29275 [Kofleriaceae bacterium]|nr:hypothetical protein [Kofleriaceae bacterium]
MAENAYVDEPIQVLPWPAAIRKRPGMYVGPLDDGAGFETMLHAVIDELLDVGSDASYLRLTVDGAAIGVEHDGRSFEPAEIVDRFANAQMHGMHRWGVPVTCALSSQLDVDAWHEGRVYSQRFVRGHRVGPMHLADGAVRRRTFVRFTPDITVLPPHTWHATALEQLARELAAMYPHMTLLLDDVTIRYPDGVADHLRHVTRDDHTTPIIEAQGRVQDVDVELAMTWRESGPLRIDGLVNRRRSIDGAHVTGLRDGVKDAIAARVGTTLPADALERGLVACVAVQLDTARFRGWQRLDLQNREAYDAVRELVVETLARDQHVDVLDTLLARCSAQRGITNKKSRGGTKR